MQNVKTIGGYLSILALITVIGLYFVKIDVSLSLTQANAQETINEVLPLKIPVPGKGSTYQITTATVNFAEDGSVNLNGDFNADRKGTNAEAKFSASGKPLEKGGTLYMQNPDVTANITALSLSESDKNLLNTGKKITDGAKALAGKFLKRNPPAKKVDFLAKAKAKFAANAKGVIATTLATVALYNIEPEIMETLDRVSLKDISVADDKITVTFNVAWVSSLLLVTVFGVASVILIIMVVSSGGFSFLSFSKK